MKQQKTKIDWDTVELVGELVPASVEPTKRPVVVLDWSLPTSISSPKGKSDPRTKLILSGSSAKARARGPWHTHKQLRKILPAGIETFIFGWWLVAAAIESDRDISRAVEIAAHALAVTSQRFKHAR